MPGLLRAVARTAAISGTATAVSNRVSRRQAERWAAQDTQAYPQQQYAPPAQAAAPAAPPEEDRIAKLKELGELRQQGVLTDEEFAAEKARLLAS